MFGSQTQKPPIGMPLDPTNPLLNGLLWFSPGWENGGNKAADVIGGNGLTLASGTVWSPGSSPQAGGGIGCLAAGHGAVSGPWTSAYKPTAATGPWSLVCGISWTGVAHSSFGEIFGISSNNSNLVSSYPLKIQWSSTNNFFRTVSGSATIASGSAAITANTLHVLVVTLGIGGGTIYVDGVLVATGAAGTATPAWNSTSGVWCGSSDPGGVGSALAAQVRFHFGAVYGRVLSAGEAQAWTINPFQMFASSPSLAVLSSAELIGYSVTGPTSGAVGVPSSNFTLTPDATTTDVVTPNDGDAGGTFTPSSFTFNASGAAQTFTYTPTTTGEISLTLTSADGGVITGSPLSYTSAAPDPPPTGTGVVPELGFQFSAPITGDAVTFTVTVSATQASVPGTTTYNSGTQTATFTPTNPFLVGTKYLAVVSGATAADGTPMVPATFPFTPGSLKSTGWFAGLSRPI